MKKIMMMLPFLFLVGCGVGDASGERVLKSMGYTNIELGGYSFFGCSEDDTFRTKFRATGQTGETISGVLCSGLFKSITVRID